MPQIICPNCGMTINLEKRKKVDFNIIQDATRKKPESFTRLLRITKLPRKTLALRLKTMCEGGILIKKDGKYMSNGASKFDNNGGKFAKRVPNILKDRRFRTGLMLIALLISSSTSGYVLAKFFAPSETYQQPTVIGNFTMALGINSVDDLYTWQVLITFNSSQLKVIKSNPGEFLGTDYPFFLNASDIGEGRLLLGGTLYGMRAGKYGNGTLATIVFGYFVDEYEEPRLSFSEKGFFKTFLIDSRDSIIPIKDSAIKLVVLP
jgi:hypothetical protein